MDTKKEKSNNASKAKGLIAKGNSKKNPTKNGKLKANWMQKRKKQTRPQVF